jgi:hypothetical protein
MQTNETPTINLHEHPSVTNARPLADLIERARHLQQMHSDTSADITRTRDVIRATRTGGSYDFVQARRVASSLLARRAMGELDDSVLQQMPEVTTGVDDSTLKLTVEGLQARVSELEQTRSYINSSHRVHIISIARHHAATASENYLEARDAYVLATAELVGLSQALEQAGLPSDHSIQLDHNCELPILFSEKNGSPSWSTKLQWFVGPLLRRLPTEYRERLNATGVKLKLEN